MMFAGIKTFILRRVMQKMAAKHQPKILPKDVKNIVVWQFGGVGDMLLTTPVLEALHKQYPQAAIHIWCSYPDFAVFLQSLPQVESVQIFKVYDFDVRTLSQYNVRHQLLNILAVMQKQRADILVNLHHPRQLDWWAVEWWIMSQLKPKFSMGFSPDALKSTLLDAWLPSNVVTEQHYTTSYQQLLAKAGIHCDTSTFFLLQQVEVEQARQLLISVSGQTWVCLHMGGRRLKMENKMWETSSFIELAQAWVDDGIVPVLIGVESEQEAGKMLCQAVPQAINIIGKTSMGEMAAVIKQARLFVGHDSGPFHIAVAVNTPAVAICGRPNAEPEYIAYDKDDVVVLIGDAPEQITVDDVYQKAKGLLA